MSILGIVDIAGTALSVTRKALDTTAHNIANVNTPGYTKQDVVLESIPTGSITTVGSTGKGVRLSQVQRLYDSFVNTQLSNEKSNLAYWDAYRSGTIKIENIFNETGDNGINAAILDFFNAWGSVSQDTQSDSARIALMQKADYLNSRISNAYTALDDERTELYKSSQSLVDQINSAVSKIADLDSKIAASPGALDLIDQRDNTLQQLNQMVKVSSFTDNSGSYTILLNGTPLLSGGTAYAMDVRTDTNNNMVFRVGAVDSNGKIIDSTATDVTDSISGGELKANLDLRDTGIVDYFNRLNAFAIDLSDAVNYYNEQGFGLDGKSGRSFFSLSSNSALITDPTNGSLSRVMVTDSSVADYHTKYSIDCINSAAYGQLAAADQANYIQDGAVYWRVQKSVDSGTTWTAISPNTAYNPSDASTLDETKVNLSPDSSAHFSRTLEFEGIKIQVDGNPDPSVVTPASPYILQLNQNAAREITTSFTDPKTVAAASGMFKLDSSNNTLVFDEGNGPLTVTVPTGTYTGDSLATAIKTDMEGADATTANTYTVSYNSYLKEFKVISNTTGTPVNMMWGNSTIGSVIGYTTNDDNYSISDGTVAWVANQITIGAGNNTISFKEGGTTRTATLSAATYNNTIPANITALCSDIKTQLEAAVPASSNTYSVTYDATTQKIRIVSNSGNGTVTFLWNDPASTAAATLGFTTQQSITDGFTGASVAAQANKGVPGDNTNALNIAGLVNDSSAIAGSSPVDFYGQLVSDVGVRSQSAKQSDQFQSTLVQQLENKREELSGVSLDEEAANLVKYQKSYEAAAKLITVADQLLSTLLDMVGK